MRGPPLRVQLLGCNTRGAHFGHDGWQQNARRLLGAQLLGCKTCAASFGYNVFAAMQRLRPRVTAVISDSKADRADDGLRATSGRHAAYPSNASRSRLQRRVYFAMSPHGPMGNNLMRDETTHHFGLESDNWCPLDSGRLAPRATRASVRVSSNTYAALPLTK